MEDQTGNAGGSGGNDLHDGHRGSVTPVSAGSPPAGVDGAFGCISISGFCFAYGAVEGCERSRPDDERFVFVDGRHRHRLAHPSR